MPLANISTGASGVMPVQTPQINVMDVLATNKAMNEALLQNIQLHQALADELQVNDKRNKAATSGYDLQTQQNKDQLGLEPSVVQAKQAQLNRDIQVTPAQTALDLGSIQAQKTLQPGQLAGALQGQNIALPQQQVEVNETQQDPTGGLTNLRKTYQGLFGYTPTAQDGSIDYAKMKNFSNQLAALKMRQAMASNPAIAAAIKAAMDKNRYDVAFGLSGFSDGKTSPEDYLQQLQNSPTPLSPQDAQKSASDFNALNEGLKKLNDLHTIINDPSHDVVGPRIGQGDVIGQGYAKVKAWLGGDQTKLADQQRIEQAIAQQLGDMMKQFSGIRNQKEFNALGQRIPSMANNRDNWNTYINDANSTIRQAMESIKSGLPSGVAVGQPFQAPSTAQSAQPAKPDYSNRPVVHSQAEYDSLKPGTAYVDAQGNPGFKH